MFVVKGFFEEEGGGMGGARGGGRAPNTRVDGGERERGEEGTGSQGDGGGRRQRRGAVESAFRLGCI